MSKTILVRKFMQSVSVTLQDISPQYTRWTEVELVQFINLGQRAIAAYVPHAGSRVDAIRLDPGTRQDITIKLAAEIKTSDGSTAVDTYGISLIAGGVMRNMGADGLTPGKTVRLVDLYTKNTTNEDWHSSAAAVAVKTVTVDGRTPKVFYVWPPVHASTQVWVELPWIAEPNRVPDGGVPGSEIYLASGSSTTLLGISDEFEEDLRNYVIGAALMKGSKNEQNTQKAMLHIAAFTSSINAKATVIGGVNPKLEALPFIDVGASQPGA